MAPAQTGGLRQGPEAKPTGGAAYEAKGDHVLTITMSRLKVRISGSVLVRSSASDTPLKRSTFRFTLNASVIFSCFSLDLADLPDFLDSAGFLGSAGAAGSDALAFLFLPLRASGRRACRPSYGDAGLGTLRAASQQSDPGPPCHPAP